MQLWLGALLAIAAVVAWFFVPRKGGARNLDVPGALAEAVKWLYNLGTEGAEIRVEVRREATQYVTLTKHIRGPGDIELRGTLPVKDLPVGRRNSVCEQLARQDMPCSNAPGSGEARLQVQAGGDLKKAELFVRTAMETGFGVTVSTDCVYYVKKLLMFNRPAFTGMPDP